jgi:hypothetical protein
MSSSRTGAFDKETLVDVPIFPIIQVLMAAGLPALDNPPVSKMQFNCVGEMRSHVSFIKMEFYEP